MGSFFLLSQRISCQVEQLILEKRPLILRNDRQIVVPHGRSHRQLDGNVDRRIQRIIGEDLQDGIVNAGLGQHGGVEDHIGRSGRISRYRACDGVGGQPDYIQAAGECRFHVIEYNISYTTAAVVSRQTSTLTGLSGVGANIDSLIHPAVGVLFAWLISRVQTFVPSI